MKQHFLDQRIVSSLKSMDKGNFWSKDKILLFKELAYLLAGGVGLLEGLQLLMQSSDNFALRDISVRILSFLKQGKPFSYALMRLPEYFDEGDVGIIKAGELSGTLPTVLQSLADEYTYVADVKNKYIGALLYPCILLVVALFAVVSLFAFVLPSVFSIASTFPNLELPTMTRILKELSDFFVVHRQGILWSIGGVSIIWGIFFSTDIGKRSWFQILLNIPLLGKMTKYYYLVKWLRYMRLMLVSGMSYVQSFQLLRDILGIPAYQDMLERVLAGLQEGKSIHDGLSKELDLLPADVAVMIKVGEETARLPQVLNNMLTMYDTELGLLITRLSKVIEPIMLVFIGGIVVIIALGVFGLILHIMDGAWV